MLEIIVDTDLGDDIDDAFALCLAMQSPEIKMLGVGTVFRDAKSRAKMVKRLLTLGGFGGVPVCAGESKPLEITSLHSKPIDYSKKPTGYKAEYDDTVYDADNVVEFYADILRKAEKPIRIVTMGALTNVAELLTAHPELHCKIEEISIMGGCFFYMNKCEYNFSCDPHAADIVLCSGVPVYCVGVDLTFRCRLSDCSVEQLRKIDHPCIKMLVEMTDMWGHAVFLHDPVALMAVFDKSLLKYKQITCRVETNAVYANGCVVSMDDTDWQNTYHGSPVNACYDIQEDKFVDRVMERLLRFGEAEQN